MHTEPNNKDRMVTDEHPGYDARAHWCGEDRYAMRTACGDTKWAVRDEDGHWRQASEAEFNERVTRPNLRRVRAWAEWAQAAWRIVKWLAVFALGVLVGAYAESAVWR